MTKSAVARLVATTCVVATSLVWASGLLPGHTGWAGATPEVSVSPQAIHPTAQDYSTTHAYAGTGAVVTIKVAPNKVFIPNYPVEVEECDPRPATGNDCDEQTVLTYDQVTKKPVQAAQNGSVTIHFLIWSPLPDAWDPYSVIHVGPGHPTALWIGDDPSRWATTGIVSAPVQVTAGPKKATDPSSGTGLGTVVVIVLAAVAVSVGLALTVSRRRSRQLRT